MQVTHLTHLLAVLALFHSYAAGLALPKPQSSSSPATIADDPNSQYSLLASCNKGDANACKTIIYNHDAADMGDNEANNEAAIMVHNEAATMGGPLPPPPGSTPPASTPSAGDSSGSGSSGSGSSGSDTSGSDASGSDSSGSDTSGSDSSGGDDSNAPGVTN